MLFDFAGDAARSALRLLGGAEHEVEKHSPMEEPLKEAIAALHHAAESMDRHVEVLEAVAATLPELTGALVKLTEQLGEVLRMAAPLEAAEREVAGLGHLFRRHRRSGAGSASAAAPAAASPEGDDDGAAHEPVAAPSGTGSGGGGAPGD
jgi:ABC-type transporter Mla subunit MlaD